MSDSIQGLIIHAIRETSGVEWLAFVTAIAYVILAAYEKVLCWIFALSSTVLYFFVCYSAQLYLETLLQVFYFGMGIYGWTQWKSSSHEKNSKIQSWIFKKNIPVLITGAICSPILGYLFFRYTNASQPWLDAAITSFSLLATWMVAKKILENWMYWMVIDCTAIVLYGNKHLYLTALLYFIYSVLSVFGYLKWKQLYMAQSHE